MQDYIAQTTLQLQSVVDAINSLSELSQDTEVIGGSDKFATQLWNLHAAVQTLAGIDAPPEMAAIHAALLDATADCERITEHIKSYSDLSSKDSVDSANFLIRSCGNKLYSALEMLKDYQAQ